MSTEFFHVFQDCVSLNWNVHTQCLVHALRGREMGLDGIVFIVPTSCNTMVDMVSNMRLIT